MSNTIVDFLQTISNDEPSVICPACGSVLRINTKGSYKIILTENARLELDGDINKYRNYLKSIEDILKMINIFGVSPTPISQYPYQRELQEHKYLSAGGYYKGTIGVTGIEKYIDYHIDYFEDEKNFYSLPRVNEIEQILQDKSDTAKEKQNGFYNILKNILIKGAEPYTVAGPLPDLIFEQEYISQWMQDVYKTRLNEMENLLNEVCPSYNKYLSLILELNSALKKYTSDMLDIKEGVLRIKYLLAILCGHESASFKFFPKTNSIENPEKFLLLSPLKIRAKYPFSLPRQTFLSSKLLKRLLCSEIVLRNQNFNWNKSFVEKVRKEKFTEQSSNTDANTNANFTNLGNQTNNFSSFGSINTGKEHTKLANETKDIIDQLIKNLGEQITSFITFICSGITGNNFELKKQPTDLQDGNIDLCGWFPKLEKTHSIILLGSPGTSKSTAMLTGFTTFYNNVAELGGTISFDSPEDEFLMKELGKDYWLGKMPKPTEKGNRTSIKLSVIFPQKESSQKFNYVFTDIAGELIARSLTKEGSDPFVLRILKNAEFMIFFFDLSIEPCIREKLIRGNNNKIWEKLEKNFGKVQSVRNNEAEISQLQLLQKLIGDLAIQKNNNLKEMKFICVIPKVDLFVHSNKEENLIDQQLPNAYFFTPLFDALAECHLFVPSLHHKVKSYDGFTSILGSSIGDRNDLPIKAQLEIIKYVSDLTQQYLTNIGNALANQEENFPFKSSLNETIRVRLINILKSSFGNDNTFFLPISARGEDNKDDKTNNDKPLENNENDNDKLDMIGHPPNQKLSEYVFALPIILTATSPTKNEN